MIVFYGLCYLIVGAVLLLSALAGYVASAEIDTADPTGEQRTEIQIEEATPKKSKSDDVAD